MKRKVSLFILPVFFFLSNLLQAQDTIPILRRVFDTSLIRPDQPQLFVRRGPVNPTMRGFADLHCHQMAHLAFGGNAFYGKPFGPAYKELDPCDDAHGPDGITDIMGNFLLNFGYGVSGIGHNVNGYGSYKGWPRWNSLTHQAVYVDWLRRAVDGGLRLMVMHAVNNEFLGSINPVRKWDHSDATAIRMQVDEAYAMQDYIDSEYGGAGKGWYRIVRTPEEAEKVIKDNKLAVVLGIEVDYPFGSKDPKVDIFTVRNIFNEYYDMGIRHFYPIHFDNNALGGAAYDKSLDDNLQAPVKNPAAPYKMNTIDGRVKGYTAKGGRINAAGLNWTGMYLINLLIHSGVIIDIDHMSQASRATTLGIAESMHYPAMVSGHTGFIDIAAGDKKHEGNLTRTEVKKIFNLGGMVAPILWQGKYGDIKQYSTRTIYTCGGTAESWAQAFLYAKDLMPGRPIGIGTDFNGGIPGTGPRFGPNACPYGMRPTTVNKRPVIYPFVCDASMPANSFNESVIGVAAYNINTDGFAHYGMFPDFIKEVESVGVTARDLEPFYYSAKYYIDMWKKAIEVSSNLFEVRYRSNVSYTRSVVSNSHTKKVFKLSEAIITINGTDITAENKFYPFETPLPRTGIVMNVNRQVVARLGSSFKIPLTNCQYVQVKMPLQNGAVLNHSPNPGEYESATDKQSYFVWNGFEKQTFIVKLDGLAQEYNVIVKLKDPSTF